MNMDDYGLGMVMITITTDYACRQNISHQGRARPSQEWNGLDDVC